MTNNGQDRVQSVMLWFKNLELDSGDPKWSSGMLDRFFKEATSVPDGSLRDLYQGLDVALKTCTVELTDTVANLIKDVVVQGFTQHRAAYDSMDWCWANEELAQGASSARCYFFLLALPPDKATPQSVAAIYRGLQDTPYQQEAADTLSDDLENPEVQKLLVCK
jgi:hypothetical protein